MTVLLAALALLAPVLALPALVLLARLERAVLAPQPPSSPSATSARQERSGWQNAPARIGAVTRKRWWNPECWWRFLLVRTLVPVVPAALGGYALAVRTGAEPLRLSGWSDVLVIAGGVLLVCLAVAGGELWDREARRRKAGSGGSPRRRGAF